MIISSPRGRREPRARGCVTGHGWEGYMSVTPATLALQEVGMAARWAWDWTGGWLSGRNAPTLSCPVHSNLWSPVG